MELGTHEPQTNTDVGEPTYLNICTCSSPPVPYPIDPRTYMNKTPTTRTHTVHTPVYTNRHGYVHVVPLTLLPNIEVGLRKKDPREPYGSSRYSGELTCVGTTLPLPFTESLSARPPLTSPLFSPRQHPYPAPSKTDVYSFYKSLKVGHSVGLVGSFDPFHHSGTSVPCPNYSPSYDPLPPQSLVDFPRPQYLLGGGSVRPSIGSRAPLTQTNLKRIPFFFVTFCSGTQGTPPGPP